MTSLDSEHPGKPEHPGEIDLLNKPSGPIHQAREEAQTRLENKIAADDEASAGAAKIEPEELEELIKLHGRAKAREIIYERKKMLRLFKIKIDPDLIHKRLKLKAEMEEKEGTRPDTETDR